MKHKPQTILLFASMLMFFNIADARPLQDLRGSDRYDGYFKKYAKRYFGPHFDWRWFKSQALAESNLNEKAVSPVGALGLMQIMPETYDEIKSNNPSFREIYSPRWNIAAGVYYDKLMFRKWRAPLPSEERLFLAFSSYNAGYGRVRKAVRRTGKKDYSWSEVKPYLPRETRGYVEKIARLMNEAGRHRSSKLRGVWKQIVTSRIDTE